MHGADPPDGAVEVVKRALGNNGRDLTGHAIPERPLVYHDGARGLLGRLHERLFIERPGGARIHDFGADADLLEHRGRPERHLHHAARGDERNVAPLALDIRHAERDGVVPVRHRTLHLRVADLVFKEDDGVVVADGGLEQPLGVVGGRGNDDFQSGHVARPRVQRLRVLRRRPARGAHRRANDERHLPRAARHVMDLCGLVDDLIHDERQEIAEHDVDDRTQTGHRRADAEAREARLGDRGVDDALRSELLDQPLHDLERGARFGDIFAKQDDPRVAAHFLRKRLADRVAEADLPNGRRSLRHRHPHPLCPGWDTAPSPQIRRPRPSPPPTPTRRGRAWSDPPGPRP